MYWLTLVVALLAVGSFVAYACYRAFTVCRHDWQTIAGESASSIYARVRNIGNHIPVIASTGDDYLRRRVCLKCHKVDDQIAAAEDRVRARIDDDNRRVKSAESIFASSGK